MLNLLEKKYIALNVCYSKFILIASHINFPCFVILQFCHTILCTSIINVALFYRSGTDTYTFILVLGQVDFPDGCKTTVTTSSLPNVVINISSAETGQYGVAVHADIYIQVAKLLSVKLLHDFKLPPIRVSCVYIYIYYFLNCRITHVSIKHIVVYTNIDKTLVNSLHGLLNCEIGGLDCHVITTEYRTRFHGIHM